MVVKVTEGNKLPYYLNVGPKDTLDVMIKKRMVMRIEFPEHPEREQADQEGDSPKTGLSRFLRLRAN